MGSSLTRIHPVEVLCEIFAPAPPPPPPPPEPEAPCSKATWPCWPSPREGDSFFGIPGYSFLVVWLTVLQLGD
ncbi:unnamed protein product [Effrenium voratum]|nr:unnamed protein product [Effrenium voratum]